MDKLRAELRRHHRTVRRYGIHAPANALARLENDRSKRALRQIARGLQARGAGTDHDNVRVHTVCLLLRISGTSRAPVDYFSAS